MTPLPNLNQLTHEEKDALIQAQAALIVAFEARLAELERRVGLNSKNSGKPPSSDGLGKPPRTQSQRGRDGKKKRSGGQKGHPGTTLKQVTTPDATIDHFPEACSGCGARLTPTMDTDHAARQFLTCPNLGLSSSPNIGHTAVGVPVAASRRELRFLDDPDVPFTNNQGEQDGRMMKVRQKISGGFRSDEGADIFATLRSLISTAKKHGWNIIKVFTASPGTLLGQLRPADGVHLRAPFGRWGTR